MHSLEPHHILKVKNVVVKSVYYFMEYIICKLFVGREGAYFYLEDEAAMPSEHWYLLINIQDSIW